MYLYVYTHIDINPFNLIDVFVIYEQRMWYLKLFVSYHIDLYLILFACYFLRGRIKYPLLYHKQLN